MKAGFTLIESLVYLALCAMLFVGITGFVVRSLAAVRQGARMREEELVLWSTLRLITQDIAHAPLARRSWIACGDGEIRWKGVGACGWYVRGKRLWREQDGIMTVIADDCALSGLLVGDDSRVRCVQVSLRKGSASAVRRMMVLEGFLRCNFSR